ncbi:MAG: M20 family metallopeptidase [Polyangiales bacterium]
MTAHEAASWLGDKLPAIEEELAALVEINSFTDHREGGQKVGELLRRCFAIDGLACKTVESTRYADHLVFSHGKPGVALVGHLDTVFPPGVFEGYRRDGDLRRGPGVLDMKSGLLVVSWALRALAATTGLPDVRVVVVSDEEVGSPEGQGVIRDAIAGTSSCLVFESGRAGDAIITRRKGTGFVRATAHGVAAHAGNAHKEGKNAIWALARFVDRVQSLTDYARGVTVNVGTIAGGTSKNTVPERAEAHVDLRFETVADAEELVAKVRAIGSDVEGTRIEIDGGVARLPMEATEESRALMQAYAECARASGLGALEAALIGGGSDASTSSAMGIASIDGLGPRGKGFHTKDEQVEIATLIPKAQALARFLSR